MSFLATAVGSLPHDNPENALDLIFKNLPEFPVWPQLSHVNPKEDMIIQYTQEIPGIVYDKDENCWYMDQNSDEFYEKLEEFYIDYENIVNEKQFDLLDKYGISGEFSSAFPVFLDKLKNNTSIAVKGQITGPFTYGTSILDREKRCAFYDETSRDILIKGLTLKGLWQIKKFREAAPNSIPVIFMDEPSISQYGSSAFITISKEDITGSISEIASILKENGAVVGVHCCGKTDWSLVTESNVDILNFDALNFAQSLGLYSREIEAFLNKGGYIAWGVVPTLDEEALKTATLDGLIEQFNIAKSFLINKGINEDLINKSSIITPTCGAGSLSVELATKALELTSGISKILRRKS